MYFDFDNLWQIRICDDFDFESNVFENELNINSFPPLQTGVNVRQGL